MIYLNGVEKGKTVKSRKGDKIVCFGDSLTNTDTNASYTYPRHLGWLTKQAVISKGVVGNTLTQMLSRIVTDVINLNPSICIVLGGTNDIAAGSTVADIVSRMINITTYLLSYNIEPVWCLIPPRSDNETYLATIRLVNEWLNLYCMDNGFTCVDLYTAFADSDGTTNATYFDSDGLHFNSKGKKLCADTIYAKLNLKSRDIRYASFGDTLNKITTPLFDADTNADGMSNNWSIVNTLSLSVPDIQYSTEENSQGGNLQKISKIETVAQGQVGFNQVPTMSAGKYYHFSCDVAFTGTPVDANDDMTFSVYLKHFTSGSVEISTTWVARYLSITAFSQMRIWQNFITPANTGKTQVMFLCVGKGAMELKAGRVRLIEMPVNITPTFVA